MVDLTKKPFYLNNEEIKWVKETKNSMTLDEKIGHLFVYLNARPGVDEKNIEKNMTDFNPGALRWQGGDKDGVYIQNMNFQKYSKIPLLIAANCDNGGVGCLPSEGTFVATAAQAAAYESLETAYHMGLVSAREATSIGCNWLFNPVVDIYMNWRNTIVNTRCFGDNADSVIDYATAYIQGVKDGNPNMACCVKHFPGDGIEELDQHLVMGINTLEVDRWNETYGKVYKSMINNDIESIMIGHIAFPQMSRKLRPGIKDEDIMPATLAPELLQDLLREEMKFNGLILTDASHMIGFSGKASREIAMPGAIAAGCDMILFPNDMEEDIRFIKQAVKKGTLTIERIDEALDRILGLKAKVKVTDESIRFPSPKLKDEWVGCSEHLNYRKVAADRCTTLVKDTGNYLPIDPMDKKRVWLVFVQSTPITKGYKGDPVKEVVVDELEKHGFEVTVAPNLHDLEVANGVTPMNTGIMMSHLNRTEFKSKYDFALIVVNVNGYAQENNVRLRWSMHHSVEMPWYNSEIPTIGMSLNFTNHLIDLPQIKTFINAYGTTRDNIRAAIDKMCGVSKFTGVASDTVFCDRWETRL